MDVRFIIAMMAIAMVMDFLGRMARKRQAAMSPDQGDAAEGAEILKVLTGEEEELPEPWERPPPGEPFGAADRLPPRGPPTSPVRPDRPGAAREAAGLFAAPAPTLPEPVRDVPAPPALKPPKPAPAAPVVELRDRTPRKIEVRSREPRLPERPQAGAEVARTEAPSKPVAAAPAVPVPPATAVARGLAGVTPRREGLGDRLGLGSAAALRRAVLVREVLGPPVALRDDGQGGASGR